MYKMEISKEYSLTTILFNIEKEPHVVEIGVLESLIEQIGPYSSGIGGQDDYVITRNNMIFELLITRGLVEFAYQVNCFPKNGEVFYFVKDGRISRSKLIV